MASICSFLKFVCIQTKSISNENIINVAKAKEQSQGLTKNKISIQFLLNETLKANQILTIEVHISVYFARSSCEHQLLLGHAFKHY